MSNTNDTRQKANNQTPLSTTPSPQRTASDLECERLAQKILQGLAAKRSEESYDEFKARVIGLFREKGLFRKEAPNAN